MEPEAQAHFIIDFLLTLKKRMFRAVGKFLAWIAALFKPKDTEVLVYEERDDEAPSIAGGGQYPGGGSGRSRKAKPNRKHHSTRARNRARRK